MEVQKRRIDVYLTNSLSFGFSEITVGSASSMLFTYGVILSRYSHGGLPVGDSFVSIHVACYLSRASNSPYQSDWLSINI